MKQIPSASELREKLADLSHAQCVLLSNLSGVPFTTLWKLRDGTTTNPRLDTVAALWGGLSRRKPAAMAAK